MLIEYSSGTGDGNCVPKGEDTVEESGKVGFKLNIQKVSSWHLAQSLYGKYMGKQ